MTGEIQEPFNLSLLENSIHSGSVSFGRFEKEVLSWEKRSSFSQNSYLEEAEKFSKPGSVTQMRAHFEAHFKKKGIQLPSSVEAQPWREVVHHNHHLVSTEIEENLWENTSKFGGSCVSYEEILLNPDDDHSSLSVGLEKTEIDRSEMTLEDEKETRYSSATSLKPLKDVKEANPYAATTKASTMKLVFMTKGSLGSNTKTSIDTKRPKELKPKKTVKTSASQAPTSKKTEGLTPLARNKHRSKNCIESDTREKTTTTNGFSFRSNERAEKKKEESVKAVVQKTLHYKARTMPKSTQARPQHTLTGQAKARDDAQEHSSKPTCHDQSMANAMVKSKVSINKQKVDIQRSLNRILPKSRDQTVRHNTNTRSLAV